MEYRVFLGKFVAFLPVKFWIDQTFQMSYFQNKHSMWPLLRNTQNSPSIAWQKCSIECKKRFNKSLSFRLFGPITPLGKNLRVKLIQFTCIAIDWFCNQLHIKATFSLHGPIFRHLDNLIEPLFSTALNYIWVTRMINIQRNANYLKNTIHKKKCEKSNLNRLRGKTKQISTACKNVTNLLLLLFLKKKNQIH